jgi:hypothetical protein
VKKCERKRNGKRKNGKKEKRKKNGKRKNGEHLIVLPKFATFL